MIEFYVAGEPQPFPKKEYAILYTKEKRPFVQVYNRDYRTRKNPDTGKVEKYDKGYIQRWTDQVKQVAELAMKGESIIVKPLPVEIETWVWRTRADSNKTPFPTGPPDLDNFTYLPHNALEGICYENDSQITDQHEHKRWADDDNPAGMVVKIRCPVEQQSTLKL